MKSCNLGGRITYLIDEINCSKYVLRDKSATLSSIHYTTVIQTVSMDSPLADVDRTQYTNQKIKM